MKRTCILLLTILLATLLVQPAKAEEWKVYASYHNASKAVKTDSRIFVLANGALFSYDTEDNLVATYDKVNALSDCGIKDIAYCSKTRQLVVLYSNGNIDLMGMNDTMFNLPDLKSKSLDDKTIYELKVVDGTALISIGNSLVQVDLAKRYFVNLYQFGSKVTNANMADGKIYAKTASGVMEGDTSTNLVDMNNWKKVATSPVSFGQTQEEKDEAAALLDKVKDIIIDSPIRNLSYRLNMQGERLLVAGGNFYYPNVEHTGTAMAYEDGKWTAFDEEEAIELVGARAYLNVTGVVQDPQDPSHHWLGTMRSGIYEFRDYKLAGHYSCDNSPLTSILPNNANYGWFVRESQPSATTTKATSGCATTSATPSSAYSRPTANGKPSTSTKSKASLPSTAP